MAEQVCHSGRTRSLEHPDECPARCYNCGSKTHFSQERSRHIFSDTGKGNWSVPSQQPKAAIP
eukprot:12907169-Prorocentrum_lima.AAC.1